MVVANWGKKMSPLRGKEPSKLCQQFSNSIVYMGAQDIKCAVEQIISKSSSAVLSIHRRRAVVVIAHGKDLSFWGCFLHSWLLDSTSHIGWSEEESGMSIQTQPNTCVHVFFAKLRHCMCGGKQYRLIEKLDSRLDLKKNKLEIGVLQARHLFSLLIHGALKQFAK